MCRKEVINTSPEHVVHLKPALVWNALVLYLAGEKKALCQGLAVQGHETQLEQRQK